MSTGEGSELDDESRWNSLLHSIIEWRAQDPDIVVNFVPPTTLMAEMEARLSPTSSDPGTSSGSSPEQVLDTVKFVLEHCVATSHPLFVNQLYGGVHPLGLAASVLIEKMNTNSHTFEVAPVFVLAERLVLAECRKLFYAGDSTGDGIFAPGGSFANMYAFMAARHAMFPKLKETGLFSSPPLVIFTSQDAHYSVSKAASWMGLGLNNVVVVETNSRGQMLPSALQSAINEVKAGGRVPLAVNATAGTTVLGAFDPLEEISRICIKEEIWLHCDAAWGGSFIFSERLRAQNLGGIERCDSIAWNAHKMLGAPLQCSLFLTRHEILAPCNSHGASYLFQPDKFYNIDVDFDRGGDKSFQCGRKADGFKLWLMWVGLGLEGFRALVEGAHDAAVYFANRINEMKDEFLPYFEDGARPQATNVYFWFIPLRLRGLERNAEWWEQVSQATVEIKKKMMLDGKLLLGYAPLPHKDVPNAFRLVLPAYPPKTREHMDTIIKLIIKYGENL